MMYRNVRDDRGRIVVLERSRDLVREQVFTQPNPECECMTYNQQHGTGMMCWLCTEGQPIFSHTSGDL